MYRCVNIIKTKLFGAMIIKLFQILIWYLEIYIFISLIFDIINYSKLLKIVIETYVFVYKIISNIDLVFGNIMKN